MSININFPNGLNSMFDRDGYVKLPPKVGDEPYKPVNQRNTEEINYCLNCKKVSCKYGNCKERPRRRRKKDV